MLHHKVLQRQSSKNPKQTISFSQGPARHGARQAHKQLATGTNKNRSSGPPGVPQVIDFHCVFDGFSLVSNDRLCDRQCVLHCKVLQSQNSKTIKNIVFFIWFWLGTVHPSHTKNSHRDKNKARSSGPPGALQVIDFHCVFFMVLV